MCGCTEIRLDKYTNKIVAVKQISKSMRVSYRSRRHANTSLPHSGLEDTQDGTVPPPPP